MNEISTRIEKLTPRLNRVAAIRATTEQDPDDQYQNMVLALLERGETLSDSSTDAYLVGCGDLYGARPAARKAHGYENRVASGCVVRDEDDEEFDLIDVLPAEGDIEDEIERRETIRAIIEAIRDLSPDNQEIVYMLAAGYNQAEIAEKRGVSRCAVNQRKSTIRSAMLRHGFAG